MAADTAAKRLSAMNQMCPWRGPAVVPSSGIVDDSERAAVLYLYSGFDYAGDGTIGPGGLDEYQVMFRRRRHRG